MVARPAAGHDIYLDLHRMSKMMAYIYTFFWDMGHCFWAHGDAGRAADAEARVVFAVGIWGPTHNEGSSVGSRQNRKTVLLLLRNLIQIALTRVWIQNKIGFYLW